MSRIQEIRRHLVLKLGGSEMVGETGLHAQKVVDFLNLFAQEFEQLASITLVIGGGKYAREQQRITEQKLAVTDLHISTEQLHATLDTIGIQITQFNAIGLMYWLMHNEYDVHGAIPRDEKSAKDFALHAQEKFRVMAGTKIGQSTDGTATIVARAIAEANPTDQVDLVVVSNTPGIYDKDPKHHADAKQLQLVPVALLAGQNGHDKGILKATEFTPGQNQIIDSTAVLEMLALLRACPQASVAVAGVENEDTLRTLFGHSGADWSSLVIEDATLITNGGEVVYAT